MKGKNDSTPFLPLKLKTGGKVTYVWDKESLCLTERQAEHVYKAVEKGNMINTKAMVYEMAQDQGNNPYKRVVLNNVYKVPEKCLEMKNWSIFSDNVRYIQHDKIMASSLDIDTLDYREHKDLYFQLKDEERETLDVDFGLYPDVTKARYLDVYEDIYAEMVYASKFDENSDLNMTYLGQTNMTRNTRIKVEERFPITGQGFASRKTIRWHGMSNFVRHRCYKVLHVKVILSVMQNSTCITKILLKHAKNTSGKWTICQCTICDSSNYRYTQT